MHCAVADWFVCWLVGVMDGRMDGQKTDGRQTGLLGGVQLRSIPAA